MKEKRSYPAAEAIVGAKLESKTHTGAVPARVRKTDAAVAVRSAQRSGLPAKPKPRERQLPAKAKLQKMIEQTVETLMLTATPEGDLTFRADVRADVLSDVSVDVTLWGKQIVVTFYTRDHSSRRLLDGYSRELRAHLEDRGLKVKSIRVAAAPDPNAPAPVPLAKGS
jgi:hypothetical protein